MPSMDLLICGMFILIVKLLEGSNPSHKTESLLAHKHSGVSRLKVQRQTIILHISANLRLTIKHGG